MISGYGIILEDEILYCSNDIKYPLFEILLFVEKLLRSFNPKKTWRLNSVYLKSTLKEKERIIIKHDISENQNLLVFVSGNFDEGSREIHNMLGEFFEKVKAYYNTTDLLKQASKKPIFKEIIKIASDFLWKKYIIRLQKEKIKQKVNPSGINKILYCGLSSQGLPIISKLYDKALLKNLNKEITAENIDLFNSSLSAQLATIEVNSLIRAQTIVKEIHIVDLEDKKNKKFILYDNINSYSLSLFASGSFLKIKYLMKVLKSQISKDGALQKEFSGNLKPYRHLEEFFSTIEEEF